MIAVGHTLPDFQLTAVKGGPLQAIDQDPFEQLGAEQLRGRWLVLFAWPIRAHEEAVTAGLTEDQVHDAVRIAAIVRGVATGLVGVE